MPQVLSEPTEPSRLHVFQQRISIFTWSITLLLSLRGLFAFYGMKEKGSFERTIESFTDPIVQLFQFRSVETLNIPGLSVALAAISFLLFSMTVQVFIKYTEFRFAKAREILAQQMVRINSL